MGLKIVIKLYHFNLLFDDQVIECQSLIVNCIRCSREGVFIKEVDRKVCFFEIVTAQSLKEKALRHFVKKFSNL